MRSWDQTIKQRIPKYEFFSKYLLKFLFQLAKEKETSYRPIRSLFSFSTAQTETNLWKESVKQIGENI